MSGKKSLDQIWQQMQARAAAEHQARMAQERIIWEQREIARQEYLKRIRTFESVGTNTPSSAASAAGGSKPISSTTITVGKHYVITWTDINTETWRIVVHNFETNSLSEIIDTGLSSSSWIDSNISLAPSESGHALIYQNDETLKYKILFVDSNGRLLDTKDLDTREDYQYTENSIILLGELDGISTVYHFNGEVIVTHQFPDVNIINVEVDDGSEDDVTKDGSVVIEAPNNQTYYISKPNGSLIDVSEHLIGGVYLLDYNTDYIFKLDETSHIKIITQDGNVKNTFDLNVNLTEGLTTLYGSNSAYTLLNSVGYNLVVAYDGDSNLFASFTFSSSINYRIGADEIEWMFPKPYLGKTLNYFQYNTDSQLGSIGYLTSNLEYKWLPKGSNDFLSHNFGPGTVSLIDGISDFAANRSFSLGENPITMYADPDGPIIVGFLTSTGFVTQSTGVQYASCSNVLGSPFGSNSFALFDVDYTTDRIIQIYGEDSILEEFSVTAYWSIGETNNSVNRNGTLVIIDEENDNSFIWTPEIGLINGPTGSLGLINAVGSGNRTGLSTEYQVIVKYQLNTTFITGFYLVSKSGLSEFIDCNLSSDYIIIDSKLNSGLLTIELQDNSTSFIRVLNYKIPTLELIDDYNPLEDGSNKDTQFYGNRCLIRVENGDTNYFRLIGPLGVKDLTIESSKVVYVPNDPYIFD